MSNQKLNDKQKALFEEWVKKDHELSIFSSFDRSAA